MINLVIVINIAHESYTRPVHVKYIDFFLIDAYCPMMLYACSQELDVFECSSFNLSNVIHWHGFTIAWLQWQQLGPGMHSLNQVSQCMVTCCSGTKSGICSAHATHLPQEHQSVTVIRGVTATCIKTSPPGTNQPRPREPCTKTTESEAGRTQNLLILLDCRHETAFCMDNDPTEK